MKDAHPNFATESGRVPPRLLAHEFGASAPDKPETSVALDTGLACLVMLAQFHAVAADPDKLSHEFRREGKAFEVIDILVAAKSLGLVAARRSPSAARLPMAAFPAIAIGNGGAFFILARIDQGKVLIQDPMSNIPQVLDFESFSARWSGELIQITSRSSIAGELAKFDFSWFIPAVVKYRRALTEVLLVSFVLQFFMLVTPLFFQVVMDKVLVHNGMTTLHVVCIGLAVITVFDVVLTSLRSYVFAHTSSRIDVELGARLFRHLLSLPMSYFTARRVGDSVARIRELENIRSFLTGNAITVVMDLLFSVVFIAVMLYYSVWLTMIVLVSLPCYALLSAFFTPLLRLRLNEKFNRGAENQAFLVETIGGIDTVKSMAVQPQWAQKWDNQLAGYVTAGFRTATLGTLANGGVSLVSKLVAVATIWLGAQLVIEGKLSVGQLIAFNMLAGYVSAPVIRLAQLWTEFQQVGISMQRLGDILNTRPEIAGSKSAMPPIAGSVEFDAVTFRYRPDSPQVLRGVSFHAAAGEVIGIVGRSGSGKSTLTKLVQRMYVPETGRVLIDGIDLAAADATTVRRQLGVVLQENMLFNRSIRENIALTNPAIPLDFVIAAAKLAGAHDFIIELPEAYDTMVGEHGATLSGGQRQRIAIARALISNPRVLIFDEATSALDYESERVLRDNMKSICAGRTVLIIAHRLSTVRSADPLRTLRQVPLPDLSVGVCPVGVDRKELLLLDAAMLAVCRHPQVRAAVAVVKAKGAALGVARAAWLPTVTMTAGDTESRLDSRTDGITAGVNSVNRSPGASITLSQTLFDFGTRSANEERAQLDLLATLSNQSTALQEVLLNAAQAYVLAQAKRAALDAWGDSAASAEESLRAARAKRARGTGNVAEMLQAQSALSRVRLEQTHAMNESVSALATLNGAIGIDIDATVQLPPFDEPDPQLVSPAPLHELIAEARVSHPGMVAANALVESAQARLRGAEAEGRPSLALSASVYANGRPGTAVNEVRSREKLYMLTLTVPIFEGFGRTYKVTEAEAQLEGELAKRDITFAQTSLAIAKSREDLVSQHASLDASRDLLESAAETFRAAQARFKGGAADIIELLTAQKDLANAKQERVQAIVAWRIAGWKFSASIGQLGFSVLHR